MIGTFFFLQSIDDIGNMESIKLMPVIALFVLYFCGTFATLNIPGSFKDIQSFLDT